MVRAQFSIEFIVGVSVMLVIYVLAIGTYSYYTENIIIDDTFGSDVCYNIANAIDAAVIGRNGFSLNISVPYRIYSKELIGIDITDNFTLTVSWEDKISACSLVTNDITNVTMYGGKSSATNIDGSIYITSANTNTTTAEVGDTIQINSSYIKGTQANITISNNTWSSTITKTQSNNIITHNWDTTGLTSDKYIITITDNDYPRLFAEREVILK